MSSCGVNCTPSVNLTEFAIYAASGCLTGLAIAGPVGAAGGALVGVAYWAASRVITIITTCLFERFPEIGDNLSAVLSIALKFFGSAAAIWGAFLAFSVKMSFIATLAFCSTLFGIVTAITLIVAPIVICCGVALTFPFQAKEVMNP